MQKAWIHLSPTRHTLLCAPGCVVIRDWQAMNLSTRSRKSSLEIRCSWFTDKIAVMDHKLQSAFSVDQYANLRHKMNLTMQNWGQHNWSTQHELNYCILNVRETRANTILNDMQIKGSIYLNLYQSHAQDFFYDWINLLQNFNKRKGVGFGSSDCVIWRLLLGSSCSLSSSTPFRVESPCSAWSYPINKWNCPYG